ncbi:MAG: hypothetical protein IJ202_07435 [Bacteroidales bacterium]|nr:hypothetical protein [Bacteroidales bacterium]MBQ9711453.1 hypothetical protein [Bacteroidales bacterium]
MKKIQSTYFASVLTVLIFGSTSVTSLAQEPIRDTLRRDSSLLFESDSLFTSDSVSVDPNNVPAEDLTPTDHSSLIFPLPSASSGDGVVPSKKDEVSSVKMIMDSDGNKWKMYEVDDLILGVNVRQYRDFGKWFRIDYYIMNRGDEGKLFDFTNASVKSPNGRAKLYSHDQFIRKARRRRFWSSFGANVAIMTTGVILDEILNGEYYDGRADHYSLGSDIAHDVSSMVITEASAVGMMAASQYFAGDMSRVYSENLGYVRNYMVNPGIAIEGHAYARFSRDGELTVNVPVGGRVYSMNWDTTKIESLRKGEL